MYFMIKATDKLNSLELRLATRESHLEYLNKGLLTIKMAGPLIEQEKPIGSLLIVEALDLESAINWAENDPYNKANLFDNVEIKEIKLTIWS